MIRGFNVIVSSEASDLIFKIVIFVVSEASDLVFKIVIFHDVPPRSSSLYTGFSRTVWGSWVEICEVDLTPPRRLDISLNQLYRMEAGCAKRA